MDDNDYRDIGYGVPCICDHPKCNARIDRGLSYVCCGEEPMGGEKGCGRHFCYDHADWNHRCSRCTHGRGPWPRKPDVREWLEWKLNDESWQKYRDANPEEVAEWKAALPTAVVHGDEYVGQP